MLPDPDRHAAVAGTLLLTPCSPDPGPDTPMGLLHRSVQPGGRPARYPRREVVNGIRCVVLRLCLAQAAPRTAGPGNWCTTTSWCGGRRASGRRSMMTCCPKSGAPRAVGQSQCGDPRQPVDEDNGKGAPGLGRRQAGPGPQAASSGGYPGSAAGGGRDPADLQDRDGARLVPLARLKPLSAPAAPAGGCRLRRSQAGGLSAGGHGLDPGDRPAAGGELGFPGPARWVVACTFAWLGRYQRLGEDYEVLPETTEAWIHAAMIGLMSASPGTNPIFLSTLV